jgi:DNA-binding MarR family transcriptional regulator
MPNEESPTRGRAGIRALYRAITQMRELSATMPVAELQMFLLVALNEGASLSELCEEADMKKSTASRYLLDLSDKTRAGDPGYGLVTREVDPQELRKNMYSLTAKGRNLIKAMIE